MYVESLMYDATVQKGAVEFYVGHSEYELCVPVGQRYPQSPCYESQIHKRSSMFYRRPSIVIDYSSEERESTMTGESVANTLTPVRIYYDGYRGSVYRIGNIVIADLRNDLSTDQAILPNMPKALFSSYVVCASFQLGDRVAYGQFYINAGDTTIYYKNVESSGQIAKRGTLIYIAQ